MATTAADDGKAAPTIRFAHGPRRPSAAAQLDRRGCQLLCRRLRRRPLPTSHSDARSSNGGHRTEVCIHAKRADEGLPLKESIFCRGGRPRSPPRRVSVHPCANSKVRGTTKGAAHCRGGALTQVATCRSREQQHLAAAAATTVTTFRAPPAFSGDDGDPLVMLRTSMIADLGRSASEFCRALRVSSGEAIECIG